MTGLSHSTNQNRFFGLKLEGLSLPAAWFLKRAKPEAEEAALQIFAEDLPLPPSRRLIVILPDANIDVFSLPRRIWNLAAPDCREMLLMIRPSGEESEFQARVNLTTLAAIIRDPRVVVQTQMVLGQSLEQAARRSAQADDVFVCFEEHQVSGFLKKRPLAEILAQSTRRPVYTLRGTVSEIIDPISARLVDFLLLALCLTSIIVFFALEVWIDRNSAGTLKVVFQLLAVTAEVWIIGALATRSFRL